MERKWLTANEFMAIVRMSRPTLYRLLREKAIPFVRVGGQYRFPADVLDRMMDEQSKVV